MSSNYNNYEEQIDPSFDRKLNNFSNVTVEDVSNVVNNSRSSNMGNVNLPNVNLPNVNLPNVNNAIQSIPNLSNLPINNALPNSNQPQGQLNNGQLNNGPLTNGPLTNASLTNGAGNNEVNTAIPPSVTSSTTSNDIHRRPVSTTKRAAQNRSAQKAFRQRREKYIKDLETQASEVPNLKQTIEDLRAENLRLRDYTIALQSKLIELGSDGFGNNDYQNKPTDR